ncbi:MAG: sugar phosphate isomerase/epimerase [Bacteroidota bacterium]
MNRRRFLRASGTALATAALLGPTASRAWAAAHAAGLPDALGIQLYTVRDRLPGDMNGVLEMLSRFGYTEVETAGYHGRSPEVVAAVLQAHGLTAPAAHVGLDALRADLDAALTDAQTVGHRYVVVPWLAPDERTSRDGYLALADDLNAMGERARAAGVTLGYHNHDFEFDTFGTDRPAYADLVERLDPALVVLELDLYWAHVAGYDPVALFERYPGRFPLWHVKDGAGADMAQTVVGQGALDFEAIFAASETAGLRHAILEADAPSDSLAFARESLAYVESLRG